MFTAIILMCTLDGNICRAAANPVVVNDLISCTLLLDEGVKQVEKMAGWKVASYRCLPWGEPT